MKQVTTPGVSVLAPTPSNIKLATPRDPYTPGMPPPSMATPLSFVEDVGRVPDLRMTSPVPTPPTKPRGDFMEIDDRNGTPRYQLGATPRPSYMPGQVPRPTQMFSAPRPNPNATLKRPGAPPDPTDQSPLKRHRSDIH